MLWSANVPSGILPQASPRCGLCAAPFAGPFAPLLRLLGMGRFPKNPRFCSASITGAMK